MLLFLRHLAAQSWQETRRYFDFQRNFSFLVRTLTRIDCPEVAESGNASALTDGHGKAPEPQAATH